MKKKTPHLACLIVGYIIFAILCIVSTGVYTLLKFLFLTSNTLKVVIIFLIISYLIGRIIYRGVK